MAEGVDVGTAYVTIVPSAAGFGAKLQSEVVGAAGPAGTSAGTALSGGMLGPLKAIGGVMAAMFAVDKVVGFFGDAISEARESQKVNALTENAIRATGGAAKISANQVGDLATAISNKTGIDDEAIQSGSNLLLTFKNIRNEVGAGSDVFNQATAAAVDLSAAGFGSIESASKMLGKALNDPIKGMSALGRAGVTFSEAQKKQVEAMVESGNLLGAQKIIMAEVQSQVGGAAEASATAAEKLAVKWGNFKESVGTALLPLLDKMADAIGGALTSAAEGLSPALESTGAALSAFGDFIAPVVDTVKLFIGTLNGDGADVDLPWMGTVIDAAGTLRLYFDQAVDTVRLFIGALTGEGADVDLPWMNAVIDAAAAVRGAFDQLIAVAPGILSTLGSAFGTVVSLVMSIATAVATAIVPLLPTVASILTTIGSIIATVMQIAVAVVSGALNLITGLWSAFGGSIMGVVSAIWSGILGVVSAALGLVQSVVRTVLALIQGDWSGAWEGIKSILSAAWNVIMALVTGALGILKAVILLAWDVIEAGASAAWSGITGALSAAWSAILGKLGEIWESVKATVSRKVGEVVDEVKSLPGKARDALGNVGSILLDAGRSLIQGFINGIAEKIGAVREKLGELTSSLPDWKGPASRDAKLLFGNGQLVIGGFIDGMESRFGSVQDSLGGLTGSLSTSVRPAVLRSVSSGGDILVKVYLGETELRDMVRTETVDLVTGELAFA